MPFDASFTTGLLGIYFCMMQLDVGADQRRNTVRHGTVCHGIEIRF